MSDLSDRAHTTFSTTSIRRRVDTLSHVEAPLLAVAVIVFREVLEAALIVSIVMAASVGVARPAGMQIIAYRT